MAKQRIAYIDFLKGLCIILIVAFHTKPQAWGEHSYKLLLTLPIFFMLSGCFFKQPVDFSEFLRRKVNTLIVPLVFFLFIGFVYFVMRELAFSRFNVAAVIHKLPSNLFNFNTPMWFVWVLFVVNILYYCLRKLLSPLWSLVASLAIGVAGYYLNSFGYQLYLLFDIAMVALPFFAVGSLLNHYSLLSKSPSLAISIPCLLIAFTIVYLTDCGLNMYHREYPALIKFYIVPLCLIIPMMWVSLRLVKKEVPFVSFIGKNTLIVLGTHYFLLGPLKAGIQLLLQPMWVYFTTIIGTLALECPIIRLINRYLPYLVGKKEFFTPGWKPVWSTQPKS